MLSRRLWCCLAAVLLLMPIPAAAVTLVADAEPRAVVVIADEPTPVAEHAAEELVYHVERATGVQLDIVPESQAASAPGTDRVYIGDTSAAAEMGIDADDLPTDAFVLRTEGDALYVVGREDDGDPLARDALAGTMYGVSEVLDRYLQVRWLWPGELGTYVPPTDTLVIEDTLDELVEPVFRFRRFRWRGIQRAMRSYGDDIKRFAFSQQGLENYAHDLQHYLRRHRIGDTEPKPPVGHYFSGWWQRYGEDHPEWFMMREDGERGPGPDASDWNLRHVPVCVSNPDLHRYIVEEVYDGGDYLRLGEVDRRVFCQCEDCLAWDGPQPEDYPHFVRNLHNPQVVTDRYARFWKTIQEMARERNPDVTVTTFLYWNYLPAPATDIQLNANVYGEFVPWGQPEITYFPLEEEPLQWIKDQWQAWAERGVTMAFRPNYFHGGYVMPHISTRQSGEFFQFAHQHGMVGFDYDSLYGHWATKGPMLYLHMRLFVDPELEIDAIREEYFAAFGPAAGHVEDYFDYWERYAYDRPGGNLYNPVRAHVAYPPDVFPPAEQKLDAALEAAADGPGEYADRVRFLQAGLEHARLAARFMGKLDNGRLPLDDEDRLAAAREALDELAAFRREHEHLYIADYIDASGRENRRVDIDTLLDRTAP